MNRRDSLKAGLCGGGLVALSALSAPAAPKRKPVMTVNNMSLPVGA